LGLISQISIHFSFFSLFSAVFGHFLFSLTLLQNHPFHGKYSSQHKTFDCLGLQKAYEYFQSKNHEVSIILPPRAQINSNTEIRKMNFHMLDALLKKDKNSIIYTTQRRMGVNGPWIKQHDDYLLFDIEKEVMPGGIIVSKDYFRDHWDDAVRTGDDYWLKVIEQQILQGWLAKIKISNFWLFLGRNGQKLPKNAIIG